MVAARCAFLDKGYYAPLRDTLAELSARLTAHIPSPVLFDSGCGEGYYTNRLAACDRQAYEVCGFDLSRDAVDAAAKAARREGLNANFAVASLFELPLADASVDAVVNIFAPCAESEFCRVLKPGGVLILLGAGERHLLGLKRTIYDETYENAERADLPTDMALCEQRTVRDEIEVVGNEQIANLFSMTPYYWRTSSADKQKLAGCSHLESEVDIIIAAYRKN
jgi:23S rRNA (guanine745-N1)-methyltransferase